MTPVTIDCETGLISADDPLPEVICMSVAMRGTDGAIARTLYAGLDDVREAFETLLGDPHVTIVNQRLSYDLGVLYRSFPDLITRIFDALEAGRMTDISIREKLIALATYGDLDFMTMLDGSTVRVERYSLATLAQKYLNKTREKGKVGDDTWRTNFALLRGLPVEQYPDEAVAYVLDDASDPLEIYESQEEVAASYGRDVVESLHACEGFRTRLDFCLGLISAWGFYTDEAFKASLAARVAAEFESQESMRLQVKHGLMRPAEPARPAKTGNRTKAAVKAKKNDKAFRAYVQHVCEQHGVPVKITDTEKVSTDAEVLEDLAGLDPVIDEYIARNKLQKLASTELPRMSGGPIVRPNFDVLKKTGRISSYAGKNSPYPAFNSQNVDPRARGAFIARPGHVICSADYSANELVSAAQAYLEIVGWSVLADKINAGVDTHAYLGAQIALYLDVEFHDRMTLAGVEDADVIYEEFQKYKKAECPIGPSGGCAECAGVKTHTYKPNQPTNKCDKARYTYYRTFAKPTGLGYPGGLGPKTFVKYAKMTYKVRTDEETAIQLREIWRETFPEVRLFFQWLTSRAVDPRNPEKYSYTTRMGMVRAGCSFTEAANGIALQSRSAEWMGLAVCRIVREQYDPSLGSCLLGTHTLSPIHDEILAEFPDDEHVTARAVRLSQIMVAAGKELAPDLTHQVEPAIMYRWNKLATTVWDDESSRLLVWEEKKE